MIDKTYDQFRRELDKVRVAENAAHKAMVKAFPVGSRVSYQHGRHTRFGDVLTYRYPPHCDLKIRSESGAEIWLCAKRIGGNYQ